MQPFSLKEWIDSNRHALSSQKELMLFTETECQLRIAMDSIIQCGSDNEEMWVWIHQGNRLNILSIKVIIFINAAMLLIY